MDITEHQVRQNLYLLGQERGLGITYYKTTKSYNLTTGEKTIVTDSTTLIKRALVMPQNVENQDGIEKYDNIVIFDKDKVSSSFTIERDDRISISGHIYNVLSYTMIRHGLAYKIKIASASNTETL